MNQENKEEAQTKTEKALSSTNGAQTTETIFGPKFKRRGGVLSFLKPTYGLKGGGSIENCGWAGVFSSFEFAIDFKGTCL